MSLLPITIEQTNQVLEALPKDHQLRLFARHYCQNLSQVLWQRFSARERCVFLQERYQNFLVATKQEGLILVGKGEGRATGRIVVEVLKPDMQYQLLTLLELLRDLDLRIKLTIHPVLPLRQEEGAWQILADDQQCEKLFDMICLKIEDTAVQMGIRSEFIQVALEKSDKTIPAVVKMIDDCGNFKLISAQCDKFEVRVKMNRQMSIRQENLLLKFPAEKCCVYHGEKLV